MKPIPGAGKQIACAFGLAFTVSVAVLLAALAVWGMDMTEGQGRVVGTVASLAGIGGAIAGLRLASRGDSAKQPTDLDGQAGAGI